MSTSFVFLAIILLITQCIAEKKIRMKLFTPNPAMTTLELKESMLDDLGLEEIYFNKIVEFYRKSILEIGGLDPEIFTAVPMQGTGTYANEAAIRTATPKNGNVLILSGGHFGEQLQRICKKCDIAYDVFSWKEGDKINLCDVEDYLKNNKPFSTVAMVQMESYITLRNPIGEVGKLVKKYWPDATFVIDSIGHFLCSPFNYDEAKVDFLTAKPARCLDSFPGFELVIARKKQLIASKGNSRSYVLDVYEQWHALETDHSFRFTTPTVLLLALKQGVIEYLKEGQENRVKRYSENRDIIREGMSKIGFVPYVPAEWGVPVSSTFYVPNHAFNYTYFQNQLERRGIYIYLHITDKEDIFRVGHIGNIDSTDSNEFLDVVKSILKDMKVSIPFPSGPYQTKSELNVEK